MSNVYEVEKMYGQELNIMTTNAPSNIIKNTDKLIPNTLLISSPKAENIEADNNLPSTFIVDHNGNTLQLTYPFLINNGLSLNDSYGYLYLNIDKNTLKTDNTGTLKVETNNLQPASFTNKGVVKLSKNISLNRNLNDKYGLSSEDIKKYNSNTFITVNSDGILYMEDNLLDLIDIIINTRIKDKLSSIKAMLNNNLKMWVHITSINDDEKYSKIYYVGTKDEKIELPQTNNYTKVIFDLYYYSFIEDNEYITIPNDDLSSIYSIEFENENITENDNENIKNNELYLHKLENITVIILPNYKIINNKSVKNEIILPFNVDNENRGSLTFYQNPIKNFNKLNIKFSYNYNSGPINNIISKVNIDDNIFNHIDDCTFYYNIKNSYSGSILKHNIRYDNQVLINYDFKVYFKDKNEINNYIIKEYSTTAIEDSDYYNNNNTTLILDKDKIKDFFIGIESGKINNKESFIERSYDSNENPINVVNLVGEIIMKNNTDIELGRFTKEYKIPLTNIENITNNQVSVIP